MCNRWFNAYFGFNLISKVALNLIMKENTQKISKKNNRFKATLDNEYREKICKFKCGCPVYLSYDNEQHYLNSIRK